MDSRLAARPAERRRLQQREAARRAILDATEALLLEDGYESFSIRRLAARCGYTAPTIYHHFGDKQGLIDELIEERFRLLLARLRRLPPGANPEERLTALMDGFVRFGLEHPTFYRLLVLPRPTESPPPESAEKSRALLLAPLGQLAASGRLVTADLEEALQYIWAVLHGLVSLRISRPDYAWSKSLVSFSIERILQGLARHTDAAEESSA